MALAASHSGKGSPPCGSGYRGLMVAHKVPHDRTSFLGYLPSMQEEGEAGTGGHAEVDQEVLGALFQENSASLHHA